jgi:hypothetical protein
MDDDTYIFYDNLQNFLADKDPNSLVTYGCDFGRYVERGYHSGGASYVMSSKSLNKLGKTLDENYSFCPNTGFICFLKFK